MPWVIPFHLTTDFDLLSSKSHHEPLRRQYDCFDDFPDPTVRDAGRLAGKASKEIEKGISEGTGYYWATQPRLSGVGSIPGLGKGMGSWAPPRKKKLSRKTGSLMSKAHCHRRRPRQGKAARDRLCRGNSM